MQKKGLMEARKSGIGTPFSDIVDWFNKKLIASGKNEDDTYHYNIIEVLSDISVIENLSLFFELLYNHLPINTCTIIKLNRHPDRLIRKKMTGMDLTPGHYVLISKDKDGILRTYEPIYSKPDDCKSFPYKGVISQKFFMTYQRQGYINASLLVMHRIPKDDDIFMKGQTGGNENDKKKYFSMPDDTIDILIEDIKKSTICIKDKTGGKKKKTYKKKVIKKINHKTKKSYKKKHRKNKTKKFQK